MTLTLMPPSSTAAIGSLARDLLDQINTGRNLQGADASTMLREVLSFAIEADQRLISTHLRMRTLESGSFIDPLTGINSEAGLRANFSRCSAAASRYGQPGVLLVIEIADLAALRLSSLRAGALDTYKRSLASALVRQIRTCDTAARLSDGTFIALLERCPVAVADSKGRRVAKALASINVVHGDRRIESPMRVGWAPFGPGSTLQGTIAAARHCLGEQPFNIDGVN